MLKIDWFDLSRVSGSGEARREASCKQLKQPARRKFTKFFFPFTSIKFPVWRRIVAVFQEVVLDLCCRC
ncbi:Hypothetical predicted protein [Cloeon dipterum]|uniref:Uncharacterized protein n=1 Tax=Cloeon dipterum TaxID=197152 RepID=A0A8S1CQC0_9INSE|nr:Hypothetical predicted protein [Cloeon dipterum]